MSNIYSVGLNNVGSYQASGIPFASGSIDATALNHIEFPSVTRWVQIFNHSATPVSCSFSALGMTSDNYFRVPATSSSPRLEMKITGLFLSGSTNIDVVAGLTNIPTNLIDSNWSGSIGVG